MDRFNLMKLNDAEIKATYAAKTSNNRGAAFKNAYHGEAINRAWVSITENIHISHRYIVLLEMKAA
jgi:hypothetical protein